MRASVRAGCMLAAALTALCGPEAARGGIFSDIGYTLLQARLGEQTPTGAGIPVSHIEAPSDGNYLPDTTDPQFAGKTITPRSGSSGISGHATAVGRLFYGNTSSIAPGINAIDAYEAGHWTGSGALRQGSVLAPRTEPNRVQNHSWIGNFGDDADAVDVLRRLDYVVQESDVVVVVGINNGTGALPDVLANGYNLLVVGRSDGNHGRGGTTLEVAGRIRPSLVVPTSATSWATPYVAAAAALLLDTADGDPALSAAAEPAVVRALLMAGATKEEFPDWSRTTSQPLDEVYGAGELNINNSHRILEGGQQGACGSGAGGAVGDAGDVGTSGWDYDTVSPEAAQSYFLDVPQGYHIHRLSILVTWDRRVFDGPADGFDPQWEMADLSLALHKCDGPGMGDLVDLSDSAIDNVEHIYREGLYAGCYGFEVAADQAWQYAIAWDVGLAVDGDFDGDGCVDGADYTIWADHYRQDAGPNDGDANADGRVDGADYTIWADGYGGGCEAAVPEPGTLSLLAVSGLGFIPRRRKYGSLAIRGPAG